MSTFWLWNFAILCGVLAGGVMFCRVIPLYVKKIDVCARGADKNPGAANVFALCGPVTGTICLILDLAKGFAPVYLAAQHLPISDLRFGLVMLAPVLGHALGVFNHWHGGKCIATSFGVMLAIFPFSPMLLLLAGLYILFVAVVRVHPNRICSIVTFSAFGVLAPLWALYLSQPSVGLGCLLISCTAICKHTTRAQQALLEKEKDASVQRAIEQAQELVQVHHTTSAEEIEQSEEEETQTPHRVS